MSLLRSSVIGNNRTEWSQQMDNGGDDDPAPPATIGCHKYVDRNQRPTLDPIMRGMSVVRRKSFVQEFVQSKGAPQIFILVFLVVLGYGSTTGMVPAIMSDRYARLNHGYVNDTSCAEHEITEKPQACLDGSADAQNAAAMEQFTENAITFVTSSLIGSFSDEYGRKPFLIAAIMLTLLSPLSLCLVQVLPELSPWWYYSACSTSGFVNWIAVSLSVLADIMPPEWRASSFGILLAGIYFGFAMAPQLARILGHLEVAILALVSIMMALVTAICFLPETLPRDVAYQVKRARKAENQRILSSASNQQLLLWKLGKPLRDLSIINRSHLFRVLSLLAFFSSMVSSADQTILIYYIEERLGFRDSDVAYMFLITGTLGMLAQSLVLKWLVDVIGDRYVIMTSFALGMVSNFLYGMADCKSTIFVSAAVAAFVHMAFPAISAIKANNVEESEQGRIQGALYSLKALGAAVGPLLLRCVDHFTKNIALFGPGTMFVVASGLYAVAVFYAWDLPDTGVSTKKRNNNETVSYHDDEEASEAATFASEDATISTRSEEMFTPIETTTLLGGHN